MTRLTKLLLVAPLALLSAVATAQEGKPTPTKPATKKPSKPQTVAVGGTMPAGMSLRNLNGAQVALDQTKKDEKVLVLHFWSVSCPYEKAAEPKLNQLSLDFGNKDVVVMGIAANQNEIGPRPDAEAFKTKDKAAMPYANLRKAAKRGELNHSVLVDHEGKLGKLLMAKTTPHCYVFDKKGKLIYTGALDDNPRDPAVEYVRDAIECALEGTKVETASTKPYG